MNSDHLSRYSQQRLERIVKLTRAVLASRQREECVVNQRFLNAVNLYADLLGQALLLGNYCDKAEQRFLDHLLKDTPDSPSVQRELARLRSSIESDYDYSMLADDHVIAKKGVIGWSNEQILRWRQWLSGNPFGEVDCVVGILSRGITDSVIVARILEVPFVFVGLSNYRLGYTELIEWQPGSLKPYQSASLLLIDAHIRTGRTIAKSYADLTKLGCISVKCYCSESDLADDHVLENLLPLEIPREFGVCFQGDLVVSANTMHTRAPFVAMCGYPGCGKTLLRKALSQWCAWPGYSWSKAVRPILTENCKGLIRTGVDELTTFEKQDPEMIAREFLLKYNLNSVEPSTTLVVDGIKSLAGLKFMKRHLGRAAFPVHVYRSDICMNAAIRERNDFDDDWRNERIEILRSLGLDELIKCSNVDIDMSRYSPADLSNIDGGDANGSLKEVALGLNSRLKAHFARGSTLRMSAHLLLLDSCCKRILLLRGARSGNWELPGGAAESQETPWETAIRELFEETAISDAFQIAGLQPYVYSKRIMRSSEVVTEKLNYFFVAQTNAVQVVLSEEHKEHTWVDLGEAASVLSETLSVVCSLVTLDLNQIKQPRRFFSSH